MVKKMLILFSIFLNVSFFIITVYAVLHHKGFIAKRHHPGMMDFKLFKQLDLTRSQDAEIEKLVTEYITKMDEASELSFKGKLALFEKLGSREKIDETVLNDHFQSILKVEVRRGGIIFNHLKNIKNRLSKKQAEVFFNRLAEHKAKKYAAKVQRKY